MFNISDLNKNYVEKCNNETWTNTCPTGMVHVFEYADFSIEYNIDTCNLTRAEEYCGNHTHSLFTLQSKCSGNNECKIKASEEEFQNNCGSRSEQEYLTLKYDCVPGKTAYSLS